VLRSEPVLYYRSQCARVFCVSNCR